MTNLFAAPDRGLDGRPRRNPLGVHPHVNENGRVSTPELIVAGYVLVRPTPSPSHLESVPDTILTVSDCIMETLPHPEFWDWYTSCADAVEARAGTPSDTLVVAVLMTVPDAQELIEETGGPGMPFHDLLRAQEPAECALLGYEPVGAEWTLDFHSWHCYGVADELKASLGVGVNEHGLIESYADARRALDWMLSRPAEHAVAPVPWTVVGLTVVDPTAVGVDTP